MKWFYAVDGKQAGPVTDAQLDELLRTGQVTNDTLVWAESMPDWQPLREARPVPLPVGLKAPVPAPGAARCSECGEVFGQQDMIQLHGAWVCARCKPIFVQRLKEGVPQAVSSLLWRKGKAVVMPLGGALPCRCARCNEPVTEPPIKRTLYWHASWIYLLILVSILVYAIVALIVRKKAVVHVPVCATHRRQRWLAIAAAWVLSLGGFFGMFTAMMESSVGWTLACIALLIAGIVIGMWKGRLLWAELIDEQVVHLRGFCPEFREDLPEWPR